MMSSITTQLKRERDRVATQLKGLDAPENFDGGFVTVQRLKGSLKTTQPLVTHDEPLLNERPSIDALLRRLRPDERLFGTLTKQNANYRFARDSRTDRFPGMVGGRFQKDGGYLQGDAGAK